jgi:tetratricopeptide (TPR) repeat protein
MNLGRVYLLQERTDETIALYQDLVQDGQADADIYLLLGHALLMEDHPVSAETAYRQSLLLHPGHTEAMLGTAKALIRQERYREGLALVGEILRQEPMNRELWSLRVNAYLAAGEHEKAMQAVELARRLDCANAEMLATLGDLHLHRDQPGDALSAYEQAFEDEQPAATRMLRAAEGFLLTGDAKSAERMLTRAEEVLAQQPEMDPDTTRALLRLQGTLAQQTGDMDAAVKQYEEILRLDPLDAETMLLLADIRHDQGQLEEAVMTLERAARVKGFEADALVRQAQIEVERERYGRAVELLESAQAFRDQPHVARYLEQVRRLAR